MVKPENPKLLTFREAKKVRGSIIYGLHDANGIFYVGKTVDAENRFYQHRRDRMNSHLARRVQKAGEELRIEIIAHNPPDLSQAEADAIALHADKLVNKSRNPYRLPTGFHVPLNGERSPKACCPTCDGPMDQANSKLCRSCTTKLIAPKGSSKAELRVLLAAIPR